MGGFRIAERLLTDRIHRATGDDLIASVQMDRYGLSRGVNNRGQLLLANWIMEYPADREILFDGRGFDVERLIAGEMLPGNFSAATIELITDKAVTFSHWSQRLTIDEPRDGRDGGIRTARAGDGAGSPPTDAPSPNPSRTGMPGIEQMQLGRLGERTHGPLFDATALESGEIVIAGMGIALAMDEPTASVLAARIEIAIGVLADRRARAQGLL